MIDRTKFGVKHAAPDQNTHDARHGIGQDKDGAINPSPKELAIHDHCYEQAERELSKHRQSSEDHGPDEDLNQWLSYLRISEKLCVVREPDGRAPAWLQEFRLISYIRVVTTTIIFVNSTSLNIHKSVV